MTALDPETLIRAAMGLAGEAGERDEERVARQRGDEERPGRDRDAVTEIVDERRREEPAERATEPLRGDGLGDAGWQRAHRAEDNARRSPPGR